MEEDSPFEPLAAFDGVAGENSSRERKDVKQTSILGWPQILPASQVVPGAFCTAASGKLAPSTELIVQVKASMVRPKGLAGLVSCASSRVRDSLSFLLLL